MLFIKRFIVIGIMANRESTTSLTGTPAANRGSVFLHWLLPAQEEDR
jgi:hypothetical protein